MNVRDPERQAQRIPDRIGHDEYTGTRKDKP